MSNDQWAKVFWSVTCLVWILNGLIAASQLKASPFIAISVLLSCLLSAGTSAAYAFGWRMQPPPIHIQTEDGFEWITKDSIENLRRTLIAAGYEIEMSVVDKDLDHNQRAETLLRKALAIVEQTDDQK